MAIVVQAVDSVYNDFAESGKTLDIGVVGTGLFSLVWISKILWNISGVIDRVYWKDGATELDYTLVGDAGVDSVPRQMAYVRANIPSKVDSGAGCVIELSGGDKRMIFAGLMLTGVDQAAALGAFAFNGDEASEQFADVDVPGAAIAGVTFDFPGGLKEGSLPADDAFVPTTAGLSALFNLQASGGNNFYRCAGGRIDNPGILQNCRWQLAPTPQFQFWGHGGITLPAEVLEAPPIQTGSVSLPAEIQTVTVKEELP